MRCLDLLDFFGEALNAAPEHAGLLSVVMNEVIHLHTQILSLVICICITLHQILPFTIAVLELKAQVSDTTL